jgi:hypothetical protein
MITTLAVPTRKKPWDWPITRHTENREQRKELSTKPSATPEQRPQTSNVVQSADVS